MLSSLPSLRVSFTLFNSFCENSLPLQRSKSAISCKNEPSVKCVGLCSFMPLDVVWCGGQSLTGFVWQDNHFSGIAEVELILPLCGGRSSVSPYSVHDQIRGSKRKKHFHLYNQGSSPVSILSLQKCSVPCSLFKPILLHQMHYSISGQCLPGWIYNIFLQETKVWNFLLAFSHGGIFSLCVAPSL